MQIIVTTPDELKLLISEAIQEEFVKYKIPEKDILSPEQDVYLTFNETLRLLKISRPTLFKRMKDNRIPYSRIGKRLLFPKAKIMMVIEKLNKK